jgi:NifU-like protein involved in Fe-S cluster formation
MGYAEGDFTALTGRSTTTNLFSDYGMQSKGTTLSVSLGEGKVEVGQSYSDNKYNSFGIVTAQDSWGYSQNTIGGVTGVTSIWKMTAGAFDIYGTLTSSTDAAVPEGLGKLAALSGVREYPARVKCASLCWHTLAAALAHRGGSAAVSTE